MQNNTYFKVIINKKKEIFNCVWAAWIIALLVLNQLFSLKRVFYDVTLLSTCRQTCITCTVFIMRDLSELESCLYCLQVSWQIASLPCLMSLLLFIPIMWYHCFRKENTAVFHNCSTMLQIASDPSELCPHIFMIFSRTFTMISLVCGIPIL